MHLHLYLCLFAFFGQAFSIDFVLVVLSDLEISVGHEGECDLKSLFSSKGVFSSEVMVLNHRGHVHVEFAQHADHIHRKVEEDEGRTDEGNEGATAGLPEELFCAVKVQIDGHAEHIYVHKFLTGNATFLAFVGGQFFTL